jgi:hypothetical protein
MLLGGELQAHACASPTVADEISQSPSLASRHVSRNAGMAALRSAKAHPALRIPQGPGIGACRPAAPRGKLETAAI